MTTARWKVIALAVGALLGGCTHIETHADLTMTDASHALSGMPYSLPMVQYQITTTRTLTTCPHVLHGLDGLYTAGKTPVSVYDAGLSVSVTATAKQRYVRGETYVVDYSKLSSWLKSTSFGIEVYPLTGTLKSIDVSAEDQTGTVVGDVVKVAVVGASLAAGGPAAGVLAAGALASASTNGADKYLSAVKANIHLPGVDEARPREPVAEDELKAILKMPGVVVERPLVMCVPHVEDASAALALQQQVTDKATKDATDATAGVARATIIAATVGGTREAKDRNVTALADALDGQTKTTDDLTEAQKKLANLRASFGSATVVTFPQTLDETSRRLPLANDELATLTGQLSVRRARTIDPALYAEIFHSRSAAIQAALSKKYPELGFYAKWTKPRLDTRSQRDAAENRSNCTPKGADDAKVVGACLKQLDLVARLAFVEPKVKIDGSICVADSKKEENPNASPEYFPTLGCRHLAAATDAVEARAYDAGAREPRVSPGIFIREPVEGKLYLCLDQDAEQCGPANPESNKIADNPADPPTIAPQLGQLRFLPFRNGAFEKNTLHLEMATDGSITKFGYVRPTAAAATLGNTAAAAGKQIQDARTAARDLAAKELKDAQTAGVAALQYQIDVLAKQKALLEAQDAATSNAPNAPAIADLAAQTALLQAKLARQVATNQLVAAQASGPQ